MPVSPDNLKPLQPPLSEEQLHWISAQTQKAVDQAVGRSQRDLKARLRNLRNQALAGFLVLAVGIGAGQIVSNHDVKSSSDQSFAAVVKSGQVVSVDGCNRDFKDTLKFRNLLMRLKEASNQSFAAGRVTEADHAAAQAFYDGELKKQELPDCRKSEQILSSDPSIPLRIPTPLYPGSPDIPKDLQG